MTTTIVGDNAIAAIAADQLDRALTLITTSLECLNRRILDLERSTRDSAFEIDKLSMELWKLKGQT